MRILLRGVLITGVFFLTITLCPVLINADPINRPDAVISDVQDADVPDSEKVACDDVVEEGTTELVNEGNVISIASAEYNEEEKQVGSGDIILGNDITATFDRDTGELLLYSNGGTLYSLYYSEDVKSIKVAEDSGIVFLSPYPSDLFHGFSNLAYLDLNKFDTSKVIDMSRLFYGCTSLTKLDLSNLDTSNVTNMNGMFSGCSSLTDLNLSNLDTSNVNNMESMFGGCSSLKHIDLNGLETMRVESMSNMFNGCESLESINFGSFDMLNVKAASYMFRGCSSLTHLDLSGLNMSNLTDMYGFFENCTKLTDLNLSELDTSNVSSMSSMFYHCSSLTNLNLKGFDTSGAHSMNSMFSGCSSLKNLDLSSFDTSKVSGISYMFYNCKNLDNLDLSNFDVSNVINFDRMFYGCSSLTRLDLSSFNTAKAQSMESMFYECRSITSLDLSGFDTSHVTSMKKMFYTCDSLKELDLSGFETPFLRNMEMMFFLCNNLETLDLSGFDTSNVTESNDVFNRNSNLQILKTPGVSACLIPLPVDMCDEDGTIYGFFPILSKSIVLTRRPNYGKSDIGKCRIILSETSYVYDGTEKKPLPTVKYGDIILESGIDYLITYSNNVNVGTASLKVTGIGNCFGEQIVSFTIVKPSTVSGFSDVQDPSHPYYKAIYWAADAGITKGYDDGTFGINKSCTRGEMIMFLWRFAHKPAPVYTSKTPFSDVPKYHTFYKAILWAYQKGITKGYGDGTFGVDRKVTRGESMMFLWRVKGKPAPKAVANSPFKDVPKTHVFYKAILWGAQEGITKGYTSGTKKGTFGINENCTRGHIVTFLYRAK